MRWGFLLSLPILALLIVSHKWLKTQCIVVGLIIFGNALYLQVFLSWGWGHQAYISRDLDMFALFVYPLISLFCLFASFWIALHRLQRGVH